ncbi:MAG: tRNA dihydrouridine synthase DusB [Symbiobacteriaceae bacterium]|nr:tRNA dihydrouridine synthase DusB [Symbiobacteriaceae bacterium]
MQLPNQVVLAPMAGVTDLVYRRLAKEMGAALTITEMVNDMGLIYTQSRTLSLAEVAEPGVSGIQLFGSKPETMAQAAQRLAAFKPDLIDINMGCPTRKIVSGGAGAALMLDPPRAAAIVKAVRGVVTVPVTVKIRSGWDASSLNAVTFAQQMEEAGAAAITVHARTRDQFYSGLANWKIIRDVKSAVTIPVIGNGDIWQPQDARRMLQDTGCDGVMLGRGVLGNPWLIQRTVALLQEGLELPEPTMESKMAMAIYHLAALVAYKGEYIAVREMRKHSAWYLKGAPGAHQMRPKLMSCTRQEEMTQLLHAFVSI